MSYCPKLGDIITLSDFDGFFDNYNEHLYNIFISDLFNNKMLYRNKPVSLKSFPKEHDKESSFFHLTCKDFSGSHLESDRSLDLRRCERLHWIKPSIETNHLLECKQECFLTYVKEYKGKKRYHLLNEYDRYIIILEERNDFFLLITAFYIDYDNVLEKKLRDYRKYKI